MVREGRIFISTASRPGFGENYIVMACKPGAQVASGSSSTTITVRAGHGFSANDKLIVNTDTTKYRTVSAVTSTTLTVAAVTVSAGDILTNLGADTGSTEPAYDGNGVTIYSDMDYSNSCTNASVIADSYGKYRYYHKGVAIWELVRTSGDTIIATYMDAVVQGAANVVSVLTYGATGDGVTDDYAAINRAITAATADDATIYFPAGSYVINTSVSIPYNVTTKFDSGAIILAGASATIRIQGPIDAGMYQIFGGTGTYALCPSTSTEVLYGPHGIAEAPIQWWGCFPNTTSDCGPTIQSALAAIAPGTFLTFHGGTFKIATGVSLTRRYFNMRGETGGYHPGAGYPTFIWTGSDGGTMFTFTNPFGIRVEMCAFDGDFSAATVFNAKSDSSGTVSWNCYFDKCTFTACTTASLELGGGHATYNDDFSQALFTQCWFDRPSTRTSDASGNSLTLSSISAGYHVRTRAWNSYNIVFDTCHFFSIAASSDANQYDRVGIYAAGGYIKARSCLFYNRGTDVYIADPSPGLLPSQVEISDCESQSEELLRTYTGTSYTSQRNSLITGCRHIQSFASYTPTRTTSVYWDGPGANNQATLVLIGNNFHHDVEIGANAGWVTDLGNRFAVGKDFTGTVAGVFGVLGSRGTTNRAAYGRALRAGSNILYFGSTAPTGGLLQNDIRINQETSDTTLALDFIKKQVQAAGSSGKLNTFFGSPNYEGDCTTSINGTADFVKSYSGGTLTLTTKIVPVAFAIYEFYWRIGTGGANNDYDAGMGHIYFMRDYVTTTDSWRTEYLPATTYTNQAGPTALTVTSHFWDGTATESTTIAYAASIATNYRLRLKIQTLLADSSATFYGVIRRIM